VVKRIDGNSFDNFIDDSTTTFDISFGFEGNPHNKSHWLLGFGYRDHSPCTNRWTAKNPILFSFSDTDLKGYVLNDPVNLIDPQGLINFAKSLVALGNFTTDGMPG